MKNCPHCGRANQPTRKYCIRCGGLLLAVDQKPKTIDSASEKPATPPQPTVREIQPPVSSSSEARVTTNDEWVKPSQVARDRVRSGNGLSKPKSEMEKAKEAFARAEQVGIEETGEGIIETRMLRASEVQELMGDLERQRQAADIAPSAPPPMAPPPAGPPSTGGPPSSSARPTPPPTQSLEPQPAPPSSVRPPGPPVGGSIPDKKAEIPKPPPMQTTETAVSKPAQPPPTQMPRKLDVESKTLIPKIDALLSEISDSAFLQDTIVKDTINDLTNLHTELAQFNSDLDTVRSRMESEVRDYWNLAEVKRINFESLEEQMRLAKQEWTDASKVYQTAKKRFDNETSSREKRIKDIEKRIEKTEDTIRKRVRELEKEKEKLSQT